MLNAIKVLIYIMITFVPKSPNKLLKVLVKDISPSAMTGQNLVGPIKISEI